MRCVRCVDVAWTLRAVTFRATQDVTEQVDYELRSLLDGGAIAFPSAFTFVARSRRRDLSHARLLPP